MGITVAKFGGTSLADADQIKKVREIILQDPSRRFIVASAPGKRYPDDTKITDMLIGCYNLAVSGRDYQSELSKVEKRFRKIIDELQVDISFDEEMEVIDRHLGGSSPEQEYMASRGEYLNSKILAAYLGYTFVDPAWCICFDENGDLDLFMTKRALGAALRPLKKAVIAGFYGADPLDRIRTFSRGGSDITGSLVSLAIGADLYENWTDVSGLLAADPRIVDDPKGVEYLSYRELRTLSYMGASVLHTDAVLPVSDLGIPINIKNTNRPEDFGTVIVRKMPKGKTRYPVTGIAGRRGMTVIQVEKVMVSDDAGFSALMLDILKNMGLPFEQCLTGIDTITLVIRSDLLESRKEELISEIRETLKPDFLGIKENQSMIAVVGEKGTEACDANVRVLEAVADAGIEISTINQGAGKLNLLIGVPEERYEDAIRAMYDSISI